MARTKQTKTALANNGPKTRLKRAVKEDRGNASKIAPSDRPSTSAATAAKKTSVATKSKSNMPPCDLPAAKTTKKTSAATKSSSNMTPCGRPAAKTTKKTSAATKSKSKIDRPAATTETSTPHLTRRASPYSKLWSGGASFKSPIGSSRVVQPKTSTPHLPRKAAVRFKLHAADISSASEQSEYFSDEDELEPSTSSQTPGKVLTKLEQYNLDNHSYPYDFPITVPKNAKLRMKMIRWRRRHLEEYEEKRLQEKTRQDARDRLPHRTRGRITSASKDAHLPSKFTDRAVQAARNHEKITNRRTRKVAIRSRDTDLENSATWDPWKLQYKSELMEVEVPAHPRVDGRTLGAVINRRNKKKRTDRLMQELTQQVSELKDQLEQSRMIQDPEYAAQQAIAEAARLVRSEQIEDTIAQVVNYEPPTVIAQPTDQPIEPLPSMTLDFSGLPSGTNVATVPGHNFLIVQIPEGYAISTPSDSPMLPDDMQALVDQVVAFAPVQGLDLTQDRTLQSNATSVIPTLEPLALDQLNTSFVSHGSGADSFATGLTVTTETFARGLGVSPAKVKRKHLKRVRTMKDTTQNIRRRVKTGGRSVQKVAKGLINGLNLSRGRGLTHAAKMYGFPSGNSFRKLKTGPRLPRCDKVSQNLIDKVQQFYYREENSYVCPDTHHAGYRMLLMSYKALYAEYKLEFPLSKIGRTRFIDCKPKDVLYPSNRDRQSCLCSYCVNAELLYCAMRKAQLTDSVNVVYVSLQYIEQIRQECITRQKEMVSSTPSRFQMQRSHFVQPTFGTVGLFTVSNHSCSCLHCTTTSIGVHCKSFSQQCRTVSLVANENRQDPTRIPPPAASVNPVELLPLPSEPHRLYKVGDFVAAVYEGDWYVGLVENMSRYEYFVQFLKRTSGTRNQFRYCKENEKASEQCYIHKDQMLCALAAPEPFSTTRIDALKLGQVDYDRVTDLFANYEESVNLPATTDDEN